MVTGNTYSTSIPDGYVKVDSMVELYELMPRKQKWVLANLQLIDSPVVIYSKFSDRYYTRHLRDTIEADIRSLVRSGQVYIPEDRKCLTEEITRRESLLMLEYLENNKEVQARETKIKMLKDKLKKLK